MYAELSYFDGYHFQHIAAWAEQQRIRRLTFVARAHIKASGARADRPQGAQNHNSR